MTDEKTESQPAELTIQDLSALKSIIDVASQRGAFKPSEMVQVGQTYAKLASFLEEIAKQQEVQQKSQLSTESNNQKEAAQEAPRGE